MMENAQEHVRGLKSRAPTDLHTLAKEYLARVLSSHLQPSTSAAFVGLESNGNLKLHTRPINLQAALWMHLSEIVTGTRKVRPCEICGDLMDMTDHTSRKTVHNRRSHRERMRRYRRARNGEKTR